MQNFILALLLLLPYLCTAQKHSAPHYPNNYFRNPLDIPILLAGNFGECRSGHFHSGLDIKTQGKENLPVHAAADGYISRIKTDKGGFGHAIYVIHPNGYTTLYAHLNDYAPFLQKCLRQQQYEKKRWNIDISFPAEKFPVRKGQVIAYSGNTGSSTAPHLHFEIRNTKTEHPLNPQLFGLDVMDNLPPIADEIVFYSGNVYDRDIASYTLKKKNNTYKPFAISNQKYRINGDTIDVPAGMVGVGINADDYMNGSDNTITFYTAKLLLDDSLQSVVTLDDIGYDVSRYIHAYTDYYAKQVYKKWIQCLFRVPGNKLNSLYTTINEYDGKINLNDGSTHKLNIVLTDNNGNATNIECYIRPTEVETKNKNSEKCIPFYAGKTNEYSNTNIQFTIDDRQLYDDICFKMETSPDAVSLSDQFRIHYPYIPLHHYFDLMIKPNKNIAFNLRDKVVLLYSDGKDEDGIAALAVDKGWYKASVQNFGTYRLVIDTIPPRINGLQKNGADLSKAKQIAINVKDDITSVKTFSGLIDGKWVCFEQHGSNFFYVFDEHCGKGKHELVFDAEDENGNEVQYKLTFKR
jgi:hypothetical protein